jgi:hypothetical protein
VFGGLAVAGWLLVPKFAGSYPAEAVRLLKAKKSSARRSCFGKELNFFGHMSKIFGMLKFFK